MGRGLVSLVDKSTISFADESACIQSYIAAQKAWVPMPEVNGLSAPGYTMTARIFQTPEYDAGGTPGIAIVFVQAPDEDACHHSRHGAPRVRQPIPVAVALRNLDHEAGATRSPARAVGRAAAGRRPDEARAGDAVPQGVRARSCLGWLKITAFIDATKPKGGGFVAGCRNSSNETRCLVGETNAGALWMSACIPIMRP